MAYFDSSALVKLVIDELGSDSAAELWDGADAVISSRVAYPEVRAALGAARRNHRLTADQLPEATALWDSFWQSLRIMELDGDLAHRAGDLAEEHALSGFDAVHLASAVLIGGDQPILATWDRKLHASAQALGFITLPAALQ